MKKCLSFLCMMLLVLGMSGVANTSPIQWSSSSGGNDHWYDVVDYTSTWADANSDAQSKTYLGLTGHLVTITSSSENSFVLSFKPWLDVESGLSHAYAWLGGYQVGTPNPSNEPSGDWKWVTGEAWTYTNWVSGQPNDDGGSQDFLEMIGPIPWPGDEGKEGMWNDHDNSGRDGMYIVEFDNYGQPVPEPTTMLLFGAGLVGLAGFGRKKFKK